MQFSFSVVVIYLVIIILKGLKSKEIKGSDDPWVGAAPSGLPGLLKGRGRLPEGRLMRLPPSRSLSRRLRLKLPLRLRTRGFSWLSWHMSRCSSRSTMSISRSASSCSRRRSCSSWKRCSCAARSSSSSRLRSSWGGDGRLGERVGATLPPGLVPGLLGLVGVPHRQSCRGANWGTIQLRLHYPRLGARAGGWVGPKKGLAFLSSSFFSLSL